MASPGPSRAFLNAGALAAAVAVALGFALPVTSPHEDGGPGRTGAARRARSWAAAFPITADDVQDAGGHRVPRRRYSRIVSTSLVTDRLLGELCEPDRVVAVSEGSELPSPFAARFAGKPTVATISAIEPVLALRPDLVFVTSFVGSRPAAQLRAAGVEVFDVDVMRGRSTLLPLAEAVGALCGREEDGVRFAETFAARLDRVAAALRQSNVPRRRALYVFAIAGQIYGGTRGSSYHDVLTYAGLVDVAADRYGGNGWPRLDAETVVALDPELLVTTEGVGAALCTVPGLEHLAACRTPGHVLEIPHALLEAGPAILDAAELLFDLAYPAFARHDASAATRRWRSPAGRAPMRM